VIHGEQMIPLRQSEVTLVTAYFDFSSRKRKANHYDVWIENMMSLKDNMVIFVPPSQVERFQELRDKSNRTANTLIIEMPMNKTTMYNKYGGMDFWEAQHLLDKEKNIHCKEHYVVWNEKFEFIRKAIDRNPFQDSIFYAWVDVGYFRNEDFNNQRMVRYVPKSLKANQVLVLNNTVPSERMGGGFLGGYKEGHARWHEKYYDMIDTARKVNSTFIGKEQPWMRKTCDAHAGLCHEIAWTRKFGDAWFHMSPYLHGMGQPDWDWELQASS
jgi:hypothetical protein